MSHNYGHNGHNYSPYYQQQGQQPVNTNNQAQPEQAHANAPYYRSLQDVPAQAPLAGPPQYSSGQPSSAGYGSTYGYQTYPPPNSSTGTSGQPVRGGMQTSSSYHDANARSYVDTSALGSLAYASAALGKNSPAVEQGASVQRGDSSKGGRASPYGVSANATGGYSQPRSDSRGSTGAGGTNAKSNPISPYAASIAANALAQAQKSANHVSPQLQYRAPQASVQNQQNTTSKYGGSNQASESVYVTASQSSAPAGGSNSANPPLISQRLAYDYPTVAQHSGPSQHNAGRFADLSGYTGGSHGKGVGNSSGLPHLQNTIYPSSTTTMDQSRQSGQPQNQSHQVNPPRPAQSTYVAFGPSSSTSTNPNYGKPETSMSSQLSSAQTNTEQQPATVDPSQVFNVQEYRRRIAEAEAEAVRKAGELRKNQGQKSTSTAPAMQTNNQSGSQAKQASTEPGSKEQIEAEIKAMIEKMREYKAKDPALFSEVWEQFKKVQPPPQASSQAPQTSGVAQTAQADAVRGSGVISPGFIDNGPFSIPSPTLNQPLIPPTDNPQQLLDQGKVPFSSRKRKPKKKLGFQGGNVFNETSASDAEASGPGSSKPSPMQPTATALQRPAAPGNGAPGEEAMRQAMQAFHGAAQPHNLHFVPPALSGSSQTMVNQGNHHGLPALPSAPHTSHYSGNTSAQKSSYMIWPENKKISLAAIAKQVLESYPANSEKTISADEICSILDRSPSYSELCSILESKGFKFDRGEIARVLLSEARTVSDRSLGASSPTAVRRPRQKPDDNSPRRPRGRPRKHLETQSPATNGAAASTAGAATQRDTPDQDLAAALTSAIRQIDSDATKPGAGAHPTADTGRPLRWDESRQATTESFRIQNKIGPQAGRVVHSVAGSAPLANSVHPGLGYLDQVPPPGHLQGQVPPNQSPNQSNQTHPQPSASTSVPPPKSGYTPTAKVAKQQPNPTPLTKEQMARKRDFNEIVDLTQESEEELTYQRKRARLFLDLLHSQNVNVTDLDTGGASDPPQEGQEPLPVYSQPSTTDIPAQSGPTMPPPNTGMPTLVAKPKVNLSGFKAANKEELARRNALRSADVVQELNPKLALRRTAYNPKTIARDMLITMGRHPTERPLNWHLNSLRKNFHKVTGSSDLSTFRWDLVDPGGPVIHQTAEEEDADDEGDGLQKSVSAGLLSKKQSELAALLPEARIASSISSALPTNTTLAPSTQPAVQPRSVRGRPRGRPRGSKAKPRPQVETPGGLVSQPRPSRGSRGARPPGAHLQPSFTHQSLHTNQVADTASMAHNLYKSEANPLPQPSFGTAPPMKTDNSTSRPTNSTGVVSVTQSPLLATTLAVRIPGMTPSPLQSGEASQKRRGRPPGSANKSSITQLTHERGPENGPRPRGRPPGSKTGTPTRGRPSMRKQAVSNRTTVPPDGIGVILPSRSPSTSSQALSHVEERSPKREGKKGRGRPSQRATSPSFQVFNCRWQGCEAKLHNLETLRKHVFKLHGKRARLGDDEDVGEETEAKVPCLWAGCEQDGIFSSTSGPRRFASKDDWKHHIEKKHMEAIAWELGDGPSAHPSDVEPLSYLSDSQGRQITPLARTQGPPDPLPAGSGPSPTRAYHKAHGNITEHQKLQAELDPRVATKQAAGVFIRRAPNAADERASPEESENSRSESAEDSDNMDMS